jgi:hypothetical protein
MADRTTQTEYLDHDRGRIAYEVVGDCRQAWLTSVAPTASSPRLSPTLVTVSPAWTFVDTVGRAPAGTLTATLIPLAI